MKGVKTPSIFKCYVKIFLNQRDLMTIQVYKM